MSANPNNSPSGLDLEAVLPLLAASGIEVTDPANGLVTCPGMDRHATTNGRRDCVVYINNGVPRLHCFHQSCRSVRESLNAELYRLAKRRGNPSWQRVPSKEFREQQQARDDAQMEVERERKLAASMVPAILQEYDWPVSAMLADSPVAINLPVPQQWCYILELFAPYDVIWIGRDKQDSGSLHHQSRFRAADQWLTKASCPGSFICPNAFYAGVHERLIKHVLAPRFLVLESDNVLNRDQVGAVFRWVEACLSLQLRAVVDSGNKSLHGWFEYPPPEVFQKVRRWLPDMGCDPALFTLNQPCRLPGAWRSDTQRYQRLLYLA